MSKGDMNSGVNSLRVAGCDCHVHVIGDAADYPMQPDRPYTPPAASVSALRSHLDALGLRRAVLVQPSFYGTDNRCLLGALRELGDSARGVAVIDPATSDDELDVLDSAGVRGVRMNLESSGATDIAAARNTLRALAARIAPRDWHIQIYASSHVVATQADFIAALPVTVVLDHFAMIPADKGSTHPHFGAIEALVRGGHAYVKLSAPYRVSAQAPLYADVALLARALIDANDERVLWASDWPHTNRLPDAIPTDVSPFRSVDDRALLEEAFTWHPLAIVRHKLFVANPEQLYRF